MKNKLTIGLLLMGILGVIIVISGGIYWSYYWDNPSLLEKYSDNPSINWANLSKSESDFRGNILFLGFCMGFIGITLGSISSIADKNKGYIR